MIDYSDFIRTATKTETNYVLFTDRLSGALSVELATALKVLLNTASWGAQLQAALMNGHRRPEDQMFSSTCGSTVIAMAEELSADLSAVNDRVMIQRRYINALLGKWLELANAALPLFEYLTRNKPIDWESLFLTSGNDKWNSAVLDDVITDALNLHPDTIFIANVNAAKKAAPHAFMEVEIDPLPQPVDDKLIVYGVVCTWWGLPKQAKTQPNTDLPCCPYCKGLLASEKPEAWTRAVEEKAKDDPRYPAFMAWRHQVGKCWGPMNGGIENARSVFNSLNLPTIKMTTNAKQ